METLNDHYAALGLSSEATPADIAAAWKRLRRSLHPDMGGDVDAFAALSAAYHVLSDPQRRFDYDATLPDNTKVAEKDVLRSVGQTERLVQDYLTQRQKRTQDLRESQVDDPAPERSPRRRLFRR